ACRTCTFLGRWVKIRNSGPCTVWPLSFVTVTNSWLPGRFFRAVIGTTDVTSPVSGSGFTTSDTVADVLPAVEFDPLKLDSPLELGRQRVRAQAQCGGQEGSGSLHGVGARRHDSQDRPQFRRAVKEIHLAEEPCAGLQVVPAALRNGRSEDDRLPYRRRIG